MVNGAKERVNLFGVLIDPLTMQETLSCIEKIIKGHTPSQHVVVNVAKLVEVQKNVELRNIINSCAIINADGQGVVWAANILGKNIPARVTGIDLFQNIVRLASSKGYRLYFLGAEQSIVSQVAEIFKMNYPSLQIAGFRDGYFKQSEEEMVAQDIRDSKANVLFVAMNSPKKELFLNKYLNFMQVPFVMGVGGSFDVVAGHTRRAPLWLQKAGLEWFFRFLCEPRRMWKRYLVTNTIFAGMLIVALFKRRAV